MCDLVTSSLAVFKAAIRIKSMHLIKSCLKTRKKEKIEINNMFYINLYLKDRLDIEFTVCSDALMPEEALTSFTVSDAYR